MMPAAEGARPTDSELLATLRNSAQRRDWNACRDTVEVLLARLPVPTMLRLAHDEVQRRLPLFERHHPNMHWPRVWLEALATGAPFTFDESTPEVMEEAPGPGGNSFAQAVQQLALAAAAEGTERLTHTLEAIARAIGTEESETGGSLHRELWDLWFQEALKEDHSNAHPLYLSALGKIMNDPKVVAVGIAAWNRLADELAAALGVTA